MSIEDGKPHHWPPMVAAPAGMEPGQAAIKALAEVRRLIVRYHSKANQDWRVGHAIGDYIVNVVAGLIADAKATDKYASNMHAEVEPLREQVEALKVELLAARRPMTSQMEMQNRTIMAQNLEIQRLNSELLCARSMMKPGGGPTASGPSK